MPAIADTHNILSPTFEQYLDSLSCVPVVLRKLALRRYRTAERRAWNAFDALIAINREEYATIRESVPETTPVFYAPMGVDLSVWPHTWRPQQEVRVCYYGSFGSHRNEQAAVACYREIMPHIWKKWPSAELWLIGSNPPQGLRLLETDRRVRITGYVERVQEILATMSVVVCPFVGRYGFRSRIVEIMATGVPLVASPDAVAGMELEHAQGLLLGNDMSEIALHADSLIGDHGFAVLQSQIGRRQIELKYSLASTYTRLMTEMCSWLADRRAKVS